MGVFTCSSRILCARGLSPFPLSQSISHSLHLCPPLSLSHYIYIYISLTRSLSFSLAPPTNSVDRLGPEQVRIVVAVVFVVDAELQSPRSLIKFDRFIFLLFAHPPRVQRVRTACAHRGRGNNSTTRYVRSRDLDWIPYERARARVCARIILLFIFRVKKKKIVNRPFPINRSDDTRGGEMDVRTYLTCVVVSNYYEYAD